jgi:hypothetical protein
MMERGCGEGGREKISSLAGSIIMVPAGEVIR